MNLLTAVMDECCFNNDLREGDASALAALCHMVLQANGLQNPSYEMTCTDTHTAAIVARYPDTAERIDALVEGAQNVLEKVLADLLKRTLASFEEVAFTQQNRIPSRFRF